MNKTKFTFILFFITSSLSAMEVEIREHIVDIEEEQINQIDESSKNSYCLILIPENLKEDVQEIETKYNKSFSAWLAANESPSQELLEFYPTLKQVEESSTQLNLKSWCEDNFCPRLSLSPSTLELFSLYQIDPNNQENLTSSHRKIVFGEKQKIAYMLTIYDYLKNTKTVPPESSNNKTTFCMIGTVCGVVLTLTVELFVGLFS